ncbi:MAG: hypothetical protein ACRD82_20500, partial [Blastocatellia bacterium]
MSLAAFVAQSATMVDAADKQLTLQFDAGTLLLDGADRSFDAPPPFEWDDRVKRWRAQAIAYRQVVT